MNELKKFQNFGAAVAGIMDTYTFTEGIEPERVVAMIYHAATATGIEFENPKA